LQPPARVTSIDALRDFRAALATFRSEAIDALAANELDIRRAFDWLTEQRQFWQRAVREMRDEVTHCKAELFRRQTVLPGERVPDSTPRSGSKPVGAGSRRYNAPWTSTRGRRGSSAACSTATCRSRRPSWIE
jgi:hypothetical protein